MHRKDIQAEEASLTEIWENNLHLGNWLCNAAILGAKELYEDGQVLCTSCDCLWNWLLVSWDSSWGFVLAVETQFFLLTELW